MVDPTDLSARRAGDHEHLDTPKGTPGVFYPASPLAGRTPCRKQPDRWKHRLHELRSALEAGRGEDNDDVLADDGLLWHAPRGRTCAIAVPKQVVPEVLALIPGTRGRPDREEVHTGHPS